MLNVNICGVDFKNPVIAASGTFGFGGEYAHIIDVTRLGGISSKGLTLNPKDGNQGIRIWETEGGIMNSVGLQNPGVNGFIAHELKNMKQRNAVVIANLGGGTIEEYVKGAALLSAEADVDFIELNISCPNVKHGGMAFGIKTASAVEVFKEVYACTKKPIMVKLSPNAEDIVDMAYALCENGAQCLSLVNTFKALAIDINTCKPVFNNVTAGLSGGAIKPIALRMVYEVYKEVKVPIVGMGGITNANDAIEFMLAGATAIQVGTATFKNPRAMLSIVEGLEQYLKKNGIKHISQIIGKAVI